MLFRLFFFISFICGGTLFGFHPNQGRWLIDIEYLYLLPSVDDTYFVVEGSSPPNFIGGERKTHDFHFHSGFRVGAGYGFCGCNQELLFYYTRLHTDEKKTISGNDLSVMIGPPFLATNFQDFTGNASSKFHLWYQRVDLLFGRQAFCSLGFNVYFRVGLEWADVKFREELQFNDVVNLVSLDADQRAEASGIGPQFGIDANCRLCQFTWGCVPGELSLNACTSGSILVMKNREHYSAEANTGNLPLDIRDQLSWTPVPAFHARVGLNYATCFSCFAGSLEVGYEFNTYIKALRRLFFPSSEVATLSTLEHLNFSLHGLYVAANFTF